MPLRLRADDKDGWNARTHARMCADTVAVKRTGPVCWLTYTLAGGTITNIVYSGANGVGSSFAPTITALGTGVAQIDFPATLADGYGMTEPVYVRHVKATAHGVTAHKAQVTINSPRRITVYTFGAAFASHSDCRVTLKIWSSGNQPMAPVQVHDTATCRPDGRPYWTHDADIGDYGGDYDKQDCVTEETPYAATWYREFGGMIGSLFSKETRGEVHAKKLTLARAKMGVDRAAERARNNGLPGTSDEELANWLRSLNVSYSDSERKWRLRRKAAAKFAAILGPTRATVDAAVAELLGDAFVSITRVEGVSLSAPPSQTFWPTINPGSSLYSLGGGAWLSERCTLVVTAVRPPDAYLADFLRLMDVQLFQILDPMLPAWAGYIWNTSSDGFFLDVSEMDLVGITP